jgi:5-methylcytosine-specific restriction endonuclease McrA
MKAVGALRRAKMKGVILSKEDYKTKLDKHEFKCVYCFVKLDKFNLEWDHYIPLSKDGTNELGNVVCSCGSCNASKLGKMPLDFLKWKYGESDLGLEIINFILKKISGL